MIKQLIKSKFFKDNLIFLTSTFLGGLLGYLFHFFIARRLSISQYGELQTLLSIFTIFSVFASALTYFAIKHASVFATHNDYEASREFTKYLAKKVARTAFGLFLFFLILSPLLNYILHLSDVLGLVAVGLTIFFSALAVVYQETLRGWQEFFLLGVIGLATAIVKLVSGVSLAIVFPKASAVSFSLLAAALLGWYLMKLYSRKKIGTEIQSRDEENWKEKYFSESNIRKTAFLIFIFSLGIALVSNLDMILVKNLTSPQTAGYYGALSLLGKIILWLNLAVIGVILPGACAQGYSGKRPDSKHLLISYGLVLIISLALIAVYYLAPQVTIKMLFGEKYLSQAGNLWLFGIMAFLLSLLSLEANLSFAKNDFRVAYFLGGVVIAMTLGIAKYHSNLREIVLAINMAFLLGFFAILMLNLFQEQKSRNTSANEKA